MCFMLMSSINDIIVEGRILAKSNKVLVPELISVLGAVHGAFLENNGIIVIGRDYRTDCRMLKRAYTSGAMSTGIDLLDLHSTPLPLLQFCIRRFGASGGVYFTSGHARLEETGIRFFNSLGIEFSKQDMDRLREIWEQKDIKRVDPNSVGRLSSIPHTANVYEKAVPAFIQKELVRNKKLVLDCSYGPSGEISPPLLSGLNIRIIGLNTYVPNVINMTIPSYDSIKEVSGIVKASSADIGVAMDVDGSRAIYFDETGSIADYDQIISMFLLHEKSIKNNRQSPIIASQTVSSIISEVCEGTGQQLYFVNNIPGMISENIREYRGIFGASDTGKFYFAEYGPFSDANLTILKILVIMGETEMPLSKLLRETPKTIKAFKDISIHKNVINNIPHIFNPVNQQFDFNVIDVLYGIKLVFEPGSWILLKPALHRDAIELFAESKTRDMESRMIQEVEEILVSQEKQLGNGDN
ncbi:hypothetical protein GF325_00120 [Candidatus Bathyarchaeota archaeon]|nr:hypothetical protein [Candidatus Bathyarchaeota archaeon]